ASSTTRARTPVDACQAYANAWWSGNTSYHASWELLSPLVGANYVCSVRIKVKNGTTQQTPATQNLQRFANFYQPASIVPTEIATQEFLDLYLQQEADF